MADPKKKNKIINWRNIIIALVIAAALYGIHKVHVVAVNAKTGSYVKKYLRKGVAQEIAAIDFKAMLEDHVSVEEINEAIESYITKYGKQVIDGKVSDRIDRILAQKDPEVYEATDHNGRANDFMHEAYRKRFEVSHEVFDTGSFSYETSAKTEDASKRIGYAYALNEAEDYCKVNGGDIIIVREKSYSYTQEERSQVVRINVTFLKRREVAAK